MEKDERKQKIKEHIENVANRFVMFEKIVKPNYELLKHLTEAPDSILDKSMCDKIALLLEGPPEDVAMGLLEVKERCQYSALAAPVATMLVHEEWKRLTGNIMPDEALCTWRKNW
jgi:hypothetical protein